MMLFSKLSASIVILVYFIFYAACFRSVDDDPQHEQGISLGLRLEGTTLYLTVGSANKLWYQTCDLVSDLYKLTGDGWETLQDDLPGSYYQRSSLDGYMLDGKFVEPSLFAGCDNLMCEKLTDGREIGETVEYIATGFVPPPTDFEYADPFVRPDMITVYESRPLHATSVRANVLYFTDQSCHDRKVAKLEIKLP